MGSGNYSLINLPVPGKVIDWVVKQAASELVNLKKDDYEEPSEFISNWSDQSLFLFCLVFKWSAWWVHQNAKSWQKDPLSIPPCLCGMDSEFKILKSNIWQAEENKLYGQKKLTLISDFVLLSFSFHNCKMGIEYPLHRYKKNANSVYSTGTQERAIIIKKQIKR